METKKKADRKEAIVMNWINVISMGNDWEDDPANNWSGWSSDIVDAEMKKAHQEMAGNIWQHHSSFISKEIRRMRKPTRKTQKTPKTTPTQRRNNK